MSSFWKRFGMLAALVFVLIAPQAAFGQRQIGRVTGQNGAVLYTIHEYGTQQRWQDVTGRHTVLVPMGGSIRDNMLVVNFIEYTWWTTPAETSRWTKTWKGELWITSVVNQNQFSGQIRWTHLYNNNTPVAHPAGPVNFTATINSG